MSRGSNRFAVCVLFVLPISAMAPPSSVRAQTHTLTTGVGDASLSVSVDGVGAFAGGSYDPVGAIGPASTTFASMVALRIGGPGPRSWLSGGSAPVGTATSCTSTFTVGVLNFTLVQSVAPSFTGGVQTGSTLTQTYTITNTSAASVTFDLVRYYDGDLLFDGSLVDGGGRIAGGSDVLFETDAGGGPSTNTTFVGITGTGGVLPVADRYELLDYPNLAGKILGGAPLGNTILGDGNADGFIDAGSEYDVTLALRNVFTVAAGASAVYTTTTIFGSGSPSSALAGVTVAESGGSTNVTEGGATDTYTIALNSMPSSNVSIALNTGTQLTVSPAGPLTFTPANWNTPQTITVTAIDDLLVEGPHTGTIIHTATSGDAAYSGITIANVTVQITDNDNAPSGGGGSGPSGQGEGSYSGSGGPGGSGEGSFGFGGGRSMRLARLPAILRGPLSAGQGGWTVLNVAAQDDATRRTRAESGSTERVFLGAALLALAGFVILALNHFRA